jgi:hypothetical protein
MPANLHFNRHICQISSITLAKPALVYTPIHSTVTAGYSCGDLLRLDSTCGRSGSLVVRRERAHSPWDRFSQWVGTGSSGPSKGSPLQLLNELRVLLEPVLPIEVVELGRCNPFILLDSSDQVSQ